MAGFTKENTMHSDKLRKLNESIEDPALYKIINELITRSDLQTAAIVAIVKSDADAADADVNALTAHVAAPKKKPTVDDTAGERFVMESLGLTKRGVREFETYAAYAKYFDDFIARERRKVAEDVLALAYESGAVNGKSYHTLEAAIVAKYGKGKR